MKVFISTHPFGEASRLPVELLNRESIEICVNSHERKINSKELANEISDADVLIAGTEKINENVFKNAPNLKLISRVGIGLDGIDFDLCKKYGVRVAYTPDAPTMAVAELCACLILNLAREVIDADRNIKAGKWQRLMGNLIYGRTLGIFGLGRIGKTLAHLMSGFKMKIIANDICPDPVFARLYNIQFKKKEAVLRGSDFVSINIPLKDDTSDFIRLSDIQTMKKTAFLINTARGGVVNEKDLYKALHDKIIKGAGIDVFEEEPYRGNFCKLDNCILTSHMGACTIESRSEMEIQAVEEVIRFDKNMTLKNEVFSNE
jgi:D-3-phosphoglycerate dehydrogenase / 2-oxoglutarate reductase